MGLRWESWTVMLRILFTLLVVLAGTFLSISQTSYCFVCLKHRYCSPTCNQSVIVVVRFLAFTCCAARVCYLRMFSTFRREASCCCAFSVDASNFHRLFKFLSQSLMRRISRKASRCRRLLFWRTRGDIRAGPSRRTSRAPAARSRRRSPRRRGWRAGAPARSWGRR